MTLRLAGSTSGYTEIDAPAVAGSNTLVLPGGNGSSQQVLATNGSGALSWSNRPILQVISNTLTTQATSTSTTWVSSGLTASITPASSSNKVAIFISGGMNGFAGGTGTQKMGFKIYRAIGAGAAAAVEGSADGQQVIYASSGDNYSTLGLNYLDSPATTSSITYTLYFNRQAGNGTASVNRDSTNQSQIILMEVAA